MRRPPRSRSRAEPAASRRTCSAYIYTANFTPVPKHIFDGQDFATFAFYDLKGEPFGTGLYS